MSQADGKDLGGFSMLDLFRMEVESQAAILNKGLLALESQPGTAEALEALMRAAHSIKGAARIVQLDPAVGLAHAMEDSFVAAQEKKLVLTSDHVDILLRGVDMLTRVSQVSPAEMTAWLAAQEAEIAHLVEAVRGILTGGPATPAHKPEPAPQPPPPPAPPAPSLDLGGLSMLELFRQEVESQAAILNKGLLALESQPGTPEALEALMRAAHSVKGAARIVQLDAAVALAHTMEDCFVAAQKKEITLSAGHVDVLLKGVDMLVRISQVSQTEIPPWITDNAEDIRRLTEEVQAIRAPGAAPAVGPKAEPPPPPKPAAPPPKTQPEGAQTPAAASRDRVVRVTSANLDRLMGLAGECLVEAGWLDPFAGSLLRLKGSQSRLALQLERTHEAIQAASQAQTGETHLMEARHKIGECREMLLACLNDFEMFSRRLQNLTERLYREVISSRMRPFADGVQGFPRMVRDLARKLEKKVKLEIVGEAVEVDRDILEKLESPLNHLLRNAADHGLEAPEERLAAGKPAEGTIRLEAAHRAGALCVSVSDDGRGIDMERLREKIVSKGLATKEMAAQMTENELMDFLFLPGFSTAGKVTEISGRGVGLDVVQSMIQEVGGIVRIASRPGKGTTFHLQLPITLSVLRTLVVEISGEPYAFPLARIDRILLLPRDEVDLIEDRQYFKMDQDNVGLVPAHQLLGGGTSDEHLADLPVVVISDRLNRFGLVVDRFVGERDLVVRTLDPRLGKVQDVSAASLMEDGSPLLIVDVDDLVRSIDNLLSKGRLRKVGRAAGRSVRQGKKRVLVVDDSITVREVERRLLENRGYDVEVAVDGMDGWNAVRTGTYDLVVSDVDMPRMNGIELVTRIKRDPRLKAMPVMIVSYKDREEDRLRGLDAGANYYLTKSSFHDESLLSAVVDLIGEPFS